MKRPQNGRALFYLRDSGGRHEMTPGSYVGWAMEGARSRGLAFDGTPDGIDQMIRTDCSVMGDLFLDYAVSGHVLSRRGLDALLKEAVSDQRVSHVFIPRRDRLARPDDPIDGVKLENVLRQSGITLVFMNRECGPLHKGRRQDLSELIVAMLDYNYAGEYRRELAEKILLAQVRLAKAGFSTGGRPPYAFRRWLAKDDGMPVRELAEGEHVRMKGHHVVWLPSTHGEIEVVRRILAMLDTLPASRVAAILTAEGVPTPDHGRCRTDNGVRHPTSGVWHQVTIVNIARNPLLVAVATYGSRSMGDQLRFSPSGPRQLQDADFRVDEKPKVIRNPDCDRIEAAAKFDPLVDAERHQRLLAKLDERAGTQRGKPRSRDPSRNPLGCRVFDMACGWPMYRAPYGESFRYMCGLYTQSHGAECSSNHADGVIATRFVLSCVRQKLLLPTILHKVQQRLRELAEREAMTAKADDGTARIRNELQNVKHQLQMASRNLALSKTPEQFTAVSAVFDELKQRETALTTELEQQATRSPVGFDVNSEVQRALDLAEYLTQLAADSNNFDSARRIFDLTNARLFLRFRAVTQTRRTINTISGGVVTLGAAPPPVRIYEGRTGRKRIYAPGDLAVTGQGEPSSPITADVPSGYGGEATSIGNVSRGERI